MMKADNSFRTLMKRLSDLSVKKAYDPREKFDWPSSLPASGLWMSPELMSVSGTPEMEDLEAEQLEQLSRWELINFFSFNVHGIRELMLEVLAQIHCSGFEDASGYFHHFLDEENKHMWFFAEFCKRYGGKIYFTKKLQYPAFEQEDLQSFVSFSKILISEQISDFYNVHMMKDENLPEIIQKINRVHHEDESRHIAMGMQIVSRLYEEITENHSEETCKELADYLQKYARFFVHSFYNPSAYKDAGFSEPYEWRRKLIENPVRQAFHQRVLSKTTRFFQTQAIALDGVPI